MNFITFYPLGYFYNDCKGFYRHMRSYACFIECNGKLDNIYIYIYIYLACILIHMKMIYSETVEGTFLYECSPRHVSK